MSRVLIVDDHFQNVFLLKKILEKGGITNISEAYSGEEAVEIVESTTSANRIDLILLDVMMPSMNGFETCEKIREIKGYEDVPVILVTAVHEDLYKEEVARAKVNYFLMKPINGKELIHLVHSLIA